MSFRRSIAMRYLGQWRSLSVAVEPGLESLDGVVARFHAEHQREFAYRREGAPVELYELGDAVDTPVYDRAALPAGCTLEGPAIVQQLDSTIVVPPGVSAAVDEHLIIRMEIAS